MGDNQAVAGSANSMVRGLGRPQSKHILGMVKPHPNFQGGKLPKVELDYLRLTGGMLNCLSQIENDYRGSDFQSSNG